jgi:hypothetical protein
MYAYACVCLLSKSAGIACSIGPRGHGNRHHAPQNTVSWPRTRRGPFSAPQGMCPSHNRPISLALPDLILRTSSSHMCLRPLWQTSRAARERLVPDAASERKSILPQGVKAGAGDNSASETFTRNLGRETHHNCDSQRPVLETGRGVGNKFRLARAMSTLVQPHQIEGLCEIQWETGGENVATRRLSAALAAVWRDLQAQHRDVSPPTQSLLVGGFKRGVSMHTSYCARLYNHAGMHVRTHTDGCTDARARTRARAHTHRCVDLVSAVSNLLNQTWRLCYVCSMAKSSCVLAAWLCCLQRVDQGGGRQYPSGG